MKTVKNLTEKELESMIGGAGPEYACQLFDGTIQAYAPDQADTRLTNVDHILNGFC